jgi:isoquinoline 1-oxidoreductase alpha subunit
MDSSWSDAAEAESPEDVGSGTASNAAVLEVQQVSRRRALAGGASALVAATAVITGTTNVGQALASTTKKKGTKKKKGSKKDLMIGVNGEYRKVTLPADTMLLYVLRDEFNLRGPKFGCGLSECGACAVLLDGKQIRSCVTPVSAVGTKEVVTLDGLAASYNGEAKAKKGALHPLQQAWIDEQVPQCGYCQSGMIIQAADLLSKTPRPTVAEIKTAMNGHLCRCGTYNGIIRAIQSASKEMAK